MKKLVYRVVRLLQLPGGKNIYIADSLGNPDYFRRFSISKDDLITELKFNYRGDGMTWKSNYYKYDNNGQFITLIDTNIINGITFAYEHTIKKNNSQALPLMEILRKMVGPDMEWILHDDTEYQILPRFLYSFSEVFSNFNVLQNGSFTYHHFTMKGKYDGVNFTPAPSLPAVKTYEWVYDGQGKFTNVRMFGDGRFERELRFRY